MTLNSGLYSDFALSDVVVGTCKNLSPAPREQARGDYEGFGPRQRVELAVVFPTAGEIPQISSHCLSRCKKNVSATTCKLPLLVLPSGVCRFFDLSGFAGGVVYLRSSHVAPLLGCAEPHILKP